MDTLKLVIVGATAAAGIGLLVIAAFALLRNLGANAKGTFSLGGLKLEGTGAPVVFLLVGAGMLLSGFTWAATESVKKEAVTALAHVDRAYDQQLQATRLLASKAPDAVARLPPEARAAIDRPKYEVSPRLRVELSRVDPAHVRVPPNR
jgi:hypothetical protein